MHHTKKKIRLKIYQIFFFRVKLFEVSFKYLSNFIAPLVAAYGSFNKFILISRSCFTPNLWELGDRGDRNNGSSCTSHSVALSSCIFFHLPSVSSLFSHRLHHPALIGYAYPSYRNVEIMLTYTYFSRRFLQKRMYHAPPFSPSRKSSFLVSCEKRLLTEGTEQSHYLLLGSLIIFWVLRCFLDVIWIWRFSLLLSSRPLSKGARHVLAQGLSPIRCVSDRGLSSANCSSRR